MQFTINTIALDVLAVGNGVRIQTELENVLLENQTLATAGPIIQKNFDIVKRVLVPRVESKIKDDELDEVVLRIVLLHLALYNNWRNIYRQEQKRDLTFILDDLKNPVSFDAVIDYAKQKYRKRYREIASSILGTDIPQLMAYEKGREEFMARR
ncbi:MAG TPA: hypothetical protein VGD65_15660 [Chryseosolibacter sp.]